MTDPTADDDDPDAELVARLRRGDRDAFAALVRRWDGPLLRIAARVTGDVHEAEEVRQAVLVRLLRAPGAIREPARLAGWLRRAAVNEAIAAVRGRSRREKAAGRIRARAAALAATGPDPADALAALDESARLAAALRSFEPDERALLSLRFDEGLTFAEIADAMDAPASTVKSRVARLVARLRILLADDPDG
ncbi:ECF RNA polymerase sigma factor SigW [Aquisphaera giovannonii]|uniref:ECF RNA polymerase sigma factor SigW n=1 Tax=Aquisphaera giovannonii TaxID=406548 RepID=A0A5B9VVA0_9BACT|nr:sigma-70 family RNA polymerase sigma factor [Aquisphaera giovannonii]QEH31857.1 ECF RNA polymerase sigma factor SigW [Aquisphaera giovannonii]